MLMRNKIYEFLTRDGSRTGLMLHAPALGEKDFAASICRGRHPSGPYIWLDNLEYHDYGMLNCHTPWKLAEAYVEHGAYKLLLLRSIK